MIEVKNLWKQFGSMAVMKGLNLQVNTGETLVILGPSGIGKSVLLKHIIGLTDPDEGTIEVDGVSMSTLKGDQLFKTLRNMGMLFQSGALFDSMNVEQNVAFYLTQHGNKETGLPFSKDEIRERVEEALQMVGLPDTNKKMPSELSGGMKKRAALARLIAYRPSIILYDEPTTGLDPITAMQINELIVKTQKELKATSIVVTHDMFSALYVGDRLSLIRDGKIAHIATPDDFLKIDDPLIKFLYNTISKDPRSFKENSNG
jgi:phospholipid/cholesterol/gamma-HCH transport system ATP-binding protein